MVIGLILAWGSLEFSILKWKIRPVESFCYYKYDIGTENSVGKSNSLLAFFCKLVEPGVASTNVLSFCLPRLTTTL